jgi:anti-anti-sigma regulatory factor
VRSGTRLAEGASLSAVLSHIFHRRVEAPPVCLVALEGEHDLSTRPDLDDVLTETLAGGDPVIVDLRRATFADASILSAIITAKNAAGRRGLAVVLPSEGEVRMLFELGDARAVLLTFPTPDLAVEWCYPMAPVRQRSERLE